MLQWKIEFFDIDTGGSFFVNAVPFFRIVLADFLSTSDKTWKRWRGWSYAFHLKASTEQTVLYSQGFSLLKEAEEFMREELKSTADILSKLSPNESDDGKYRIKVVLYFCFGHLILREKKIEEKTIVSRYGDRIVESWIAGQNNIVRSDLKFRIYNRDKVVFSHVSYEERKDNYFHDWKIIASLSGQAERRRQRILLAQNFGEFLANLSSPAIEKKEIFSEIVPLLEEDFEVNEKNVNAFIVRGLGKYMFSKENKSGFYKIVKEKEKCRLIQLIEPYRILDF